MLARNERPLPERCLDHLYILPKDTRSLEEYQRARHLDLPDLDSVDLSVEAFRVMSRLAREHDSARRGWLAERRSAVRAEQGRRREAQYRAAHREPTAIVWGPSRPASRDAPGLFVRKGGQTVSR